MSIDRRHPIIARVPSRPAARALATVLAFSLIGAACGDSTGRGSRLGGTAGDNAPADTLHVDRIGYDMGDPDAPILVIEFSDFGCPYCARFALETFPIIRSEYIETGKVAWKYVPFVLGTFPNGAEAAMAAECAGEQGVDRFWQMHDELYEEQRAWKSTGDPEALFYSIARRLRLDRERFESCFDEGRRAHRTREANQLAAYAGIRATPTFVINGFVVQGAIPIDHFRMILDDFAAR